MRLSLIFALCCFAVGAQDAAPRWVQDKQTSETKKLSLPGRMGHWECPQGLIPRFTEKDQKIPVCKNPPSLADATKGAPKPYDLPIVTVPESQWHAWFHHDDGAQGRIFVVFPAELHITCKTPPIVVDDMDVDRQENAHVHVISVTRIGTVIFAPQGHKISVLVYRC